MDSSLTPHSEVRFAVVMYGGVSLAVYMSGIAQELLRMVRATAMRRNESDTGTPLVPYRGLDPVERVYRKIAYRLAGAENEEELLEMNAPLGRKFVIDVISGTSAGGINGIFLAKALAAGLDMQELKKLWISEGDASLLINDRQSVRGENRVLRLQKEPQSVFNSQRMYLKLLEAFEKMERSASFSDKEGYVDELDLFVTATDQTFRFDGVRTQTPDRVPFFLLENVRKPVERFQDEKQPDPGVCGALHIVVPVCFRAGSLE